MVRRTSQTGTDLPSGRVAPPHIKQEEVEVRGLEESAMVGVEADAGREGPSFASTIAELGSIAPPADPVAPPESVVPSTSEPAPLSIQVDPALIVPTPGNDDPKQGDIKTARGCALSPFPMVSAWLNTLNSTSITPRMHSGPKPGDGDITGESLRSREGDNGKAQTQDRTQLEAQRAQSLAAPTHEEGSKEQRNASKVLQAKQRWPEMRREVNVPSSPITPRDSNGVGEVENKSFRSANQQDDHILPLPAAPKPFNADSQEEGSRPQVKRKRSYWDAASAMPPPPPPRPHNGNGVEGGGLYGSPNRQVDPENASFPPKTGSAPPKPLDAEGYRLMRELWECRREVRALSIREKTIAEALTAKGALMEVIAADSRGSGGRHFVVT
jgi:hypothetical protein